jgi:16S rRNA G966 N2-methylase RsmD
MVPAVQPVHLDRLRLSTMLVLLDVLRGVEEIAEDEVRRALPRAAVRTVRDNEIEIEIDDLDELRNLRTVVAAYVVVEFAVRRPRELLSSDRLTEIGDALAAVRWQRPRQRFTAFRFSAAGADSPELTRFRAEFAALSGLPEDDEDGDLMVRLRRHPEETALWQVLLRSTPRPLSARAWRVVNYPGAVNATIAAAVVDSLDPRPSDRVVDLMCGSGTLVIERLARCRPELVVACDILPAAIDAAVRNQRASRLKGNVTYVQDDFRSLKRPDPPFDTLMANPPWGELVGSHDTNEVLYRDLLEVAHQLAAPDARFGLLTHDIRRFERILADAPYWQPESTRLMYQKGHHPRLYVLRHRA